LLLAVVSANTIWNSIDSSSYANIDEAVVKEMMFNLTLDFDTQTLSGCVTHLLNKKDDKVQIISFDSKNLVVTRAQYRGSSRLDLWRGTTFNVTDPDPVLGSAVSVNISSHYSTDEDIYIRLYYTVSPSSEAVLWL